MNWWEWNLETHDGFGKHSLMMWARLPACLKFHISEEKKTPWRSSYDAECHLQWFQWVGCYRHLYGLSWSQDCLNAPFLIEIVLRCSVSSWMHSMFSSSSKSETWFSEWSQNRDVFVCVWKGRKENILLLSFKEDLERMCLTDIITGRLHVVHAR